MSTDKDLLRSDRATLVEVLEQDGAKFRGNACTCCFHEDHTPSAGVYQKDGIWRFKCQACGVSGDIFDIQALINKTTPSDELKKLAGPKPQKHTQAKRGAPSFANLDAVREFLRAKVGPIESEYPYTSVGGDMVQIIFRCKTADGKTFRPTHLTDTGYILGAAAKLWPLYNLPAVVKAETIIVCEGEKCADTLNKYGFCATTSAGGAKNSKSTDWTPLAGKNVILWSDYDAEGKRYVADVESILQGL